MANIISNEAAKTSDPSTAPSIKWTMKLKLKAAHRALAILGVTDALIATQDADKWAKTYELLVGAPPPKA